MKERVRKGMCKALETKFDCNHGNSETEVVLCRATIQRRRGRIAAMHMKNSHATNSEEEKNNTAGKSYPRN